jgi:hypothetical protein
LALGDGDAGRNARAVGAVRGGFVKGYWVKRKKLPLAVLILSPVGRYGPQRRLFLEYVKPRMHTNGREGGKMGDSGCHLSKIL